MTRYTRLEREEAALICAIAASTPGESTWSVWAEIAGRRSAATGRLAAQACEAAYSPGVEHDYANNLAYPVTRYADAEAMIRNGEI